MSTQIQLKRGLAENFTSVTLTAGEPAFLIDTGKLYIGSGKEKILVNPVSPIEGLDTSRTFTKFMVNELGQVVVAENIAESDLPSISVSKITGLGSAALLNVGIAANNIPVLDSGGKIDVSVIPAIAISEVFVVSSQEEMLALDAQIGDVAIRTDARENYILKTAPATELANWVKLLVPESAVTSVNSKVGAVILAALDILMTGYTKAIIASDIAPTDSVSSAIGKLEKSLDNYAPLASPALTGQPTAPTPIATDSTTKIATTAFVATALLVVDGGTF